MRIFRRWRILLLLFGCWTLVGLIDAGQLYVYYNIRGHEAPLAVAVSKSFLSWYVWFCLSPFVVYAAGRYQFRREDWLRPLLIHGLAGLFYSSAQTLLYTLVTVSLAGGNFGGETYGATFSSFFFRRFHFGILIYWAIVLITHAVGYYRDREIRTSQLEAELAQAQLQALRMQLRPHFLFNTLNAIAALVDQDPKAAGLMVARLGDLLRLSLSADSSQKVSLKQELDFLNNYLEIEKVRFRDRLTVELDVAPEALRASVPTLLLQPLVENSIRHGIEKRREAGRIEVTAARSEGVLRLRVADNGCAPPEGVLRIREGIGLANTRARLERLYHSQFRLELGAREGGGTQVAIEIPYESAHADRHDG